MSSKQTDIFLNWLLILVSAILLLFGVISLSGCGHLDSTAKVTKGVVRIYKEAKNKVDDLHKYCTEMGNFLSICHNPECSRMLVRHNHFCDSADKFLDEIEEVKDEIISEK